MKRNLLLLLSFLVVHLSFTAGKKKSSFDLPARAPKDSCALFRLPIEFQRVAVRDFALSPAKDEIFFTVESNKNTFSSIIRMIKVKEKWNVELAPFSGNYSDLEPTFAPDGHALYFVSNRPLSKGGKLKDFDIWKTEKLNGSWSEAENIGSPVNTEANEFYPAIASNGNIYYTAAYKDAKGKEDIYVSRMVDGKYSAPESLPDSVNSALYEFNAYVSPDESYILFTSFGRADDMGGGDLYISKKDKSGTWTKAKNLGASINSVSLDYCPFVSLDKNYFFFTSDRILLKKTYSERLSLDSFLSEIGQLQNGKGNIYWIDAREVLK